MMMDLFKSKAALRACSKVWHVFCQGLPLATQEFIVPMAASQHGHPTRCACIVRSVQASTLEPEKQHSNSCKAKNRQKGTHSVSSAHGQQGGEGADDYLYSPCVGEARARRCQRKEELEFRGAVIAGGPRLCQVHLWVCGFGRRLQHKLGSPV